MAETKIELTKERVGFLLTKFPTFTKWVLKQSDDADKLIQHSLYLQAYWKSKYLEAKCAWLVGRDRLIETFFDDFDKLSLHVFIQKYGIKTDVNDFVNLRYVKDWLVCRLVETRGD